MCSDGGGLGVFGRFGLALVGRFYAAMRDDKRIAERAIEASALDWVIVRPPVLSHAPARGDYTAGVADQPDEAAAACRRGGVPEPLRERRDRRMLRANHRSPIVPYAPGMSSYPHDIYTEPADIDPDTLANLGPLRALAGVWSGEHGVDIHPSEDGTEEDRYVERTELQPIDPQPNGPQLLYGLRYHTRITKPGELETFHDQVGYWLWEPATGTIAQTLAIPRMQVAMASGTAKPDAREFELRAERGSTSFGICSGPFLEHAFRTVEFRIRVTIHDDGRWSYDQDTVLVIPGRDQPFHHRDRSTLVKLAEPTPNPLAR